LAETVEAQKITAKKLCTAFGVRLPSFLDGEQDTSYLPLLALCISRELSKRAKLPQYNTIDDAVSLLQKSKNIIVLTGAGVSDLLEGDALDKPSETFARYPPASASLTSVRKTPDSIRSFNISV
jgi:hypothetical protein